MQQKLPCDICGQRPFTPAIVGYHRWDAGEQRYGWKQRLCFKCAQTHLGKWQKMARGEAQDGEPWPDNCPGCGIEMGEDKFFTSSTWYRSNTRKDTALVLCRDCSTHARAVMMQNAVELEDRPMVGAGGSGAPLPNPVDAMARDDLPW